MVKLVKGQNDLLSQYPACINEWDFNKNHPLSPDAVVAGSSKKVWWICCKGHSYEQSINLHVGRGYGCPYCSHRKVLTGYNDLETLFPDIATEWHPYKNAELKPSSITAYSKKKVWWLCSRGHSYEQTVERRTRRGSACYYCSGHKVLKGFNDLASVNPSLSVEWHPSKNAPLTPYEVTAGSGKRVWWLCPIGHEYQATIHDRNTDNTQCPICNLRVQPLSPSRLPSFTFISSIPMLSTNTNPFFWVLWNSIFIFPLFIPESSLMVQTGINRMSSMNGKSANINYVKKIM